MNSMTIIQNILRTNARGLKFDHIWHLTFTLFLFLLSMDMKKMSDEMSAEMILQDDEDDNNIELDYGDEFD
jgi:hypothetical protein